jgi:hypothetical protein
MRRLAALAAVRERLSGASHCREVVSPAKTDPGRHTYASASDHRVVRSRGGGLTRSWAEQGTAHHFQCFSWWLPFRIDPAP